MLPHIENLRRLSHNTRSQYPTNFRAPNLFARYQNNIYRLKMLKEFLCNEENIEPTRTLTMKSPSITQNYNKFQRNKENNDHDIFYNQSKRRKTRTDQMQLSQKYSRSSDVRQSQHTNIMCTIEKERNIEKNILTQPQEPFKNIQLKRRKMKKSKHHHRNYTKIISQDEIKDSIHKCAPGQMVKLTDVLNYRKNKSVNGRISHKINYFKII